MTTKQPPPDSSLGGIEADNAKLRADLQRAEYDLGHIYSLGLLELIRWWFHRQFRR